MKVEFLLSFFFIASVYWAGGSSVQRHLFLSASTSQAAAISLVQSDHEVKQSRFTVHIANAAGYHWVSCWCCSRIIHMSTLLLERDCFACVCHVHTMSWGVTWEKWENSECSGSHPLFRCSCAVPLFTLEIKEVATVCCVKAFSPHKTLQNPRCLIQKEHTQGVSFN